METKKWYASKTLWINAIAIAGDVYLNISGHALPAGLDVTILAGINMILRFVTKSAIVW